MLKTAFSSQRFWDHMDMVTGQAIDSVQEKLAHRKDHITFSRMTSRQKKPAEWNC